MSYSSIIGLKRTIGTDVFEPCYLSALGDQKISRIFRIPLLLFTLWHGVTTWAQNVTTLTPTPFAASGDLAVDAEGNIFVANSGAFSHDPSASEVYKVTPTGEVSLFANGSK